MGVQFHLLKTIKTIGIFTAVAAYSTIAGAQTLGVQNNQVNISVPGTSFNTSTSISSTGVVGAVSGVPTTGTLTTPTFSFTLQQTGAASTTGTYAVGIVLAEASSNRRLEVYIPGVVFTFDGSSNLSGTLSNPTVNIYGRDASGAVSAATSVASGGSVTFNGSTLSFSAADQITLIQAQGGILADIVSSINNTGLSYTYTVILKRTANTTYTFQHNVLGTPTAFPTANANEFAIGGAQNDADEAILSGGQKLTGTVTFGASGGGGGSTSTPQQQASAAANQAAASTNVLFIAANSGSTAAASILLGSTVSQTTTAVNDIVGFLAAGTASPTIATDFMTTLAKQIQAVSILTSLGAEVPAATVTAIVNNTSKLIGALRGKTLTGSEVLLLETALTGTVTDVGSLLASLRGKFGFLTAYQAEVSYDAITLDTSIADITAIVTELEAAINGSLEIPGVTLKSSIFAELQIVSQNALELLLKPVGATLGLSIAHNSNTATQALLAQNATLLDKLLDAVAINVGNSSQITAATAQSALTAAGLSSAFATSLSNELTTYVKADALSVDTGTGASTVSSRLQTALNATALSVNQTTGVITYTLAGGSYTTLLLAVMPASTAFPTSALTLPDGSRYIVNNKLAFVLAPAISDVTGFAAAINTVGAGKFSTSLRADGTIALNETASNIKFISAISTAANTSATSTGSTTFTAPTGNPAATSYVFAVQHADGTRQTLVPVIADEAFIQSVGNYGFQITLDRATGVVQIGAFRFRPDYFQSPLSSADALFLNSAKDSSGVAYRPVNANGDSIGDYQVVTATGVQTFYGLQ